MRDKKVVPGIEPGLPELVKFGTSSESDVLTATLYNHGRDLDFQILYSLTIFVDGHSGGQIIRVSTLTTFIPTHDQLPAFTLCRQLKTRSSYATHYLGPIIGNRAPGTRHHAGVFLLGTARMARITQICAHGENGAR